MRSPIALLATATLAALTAVGCAAPEESEDVGDAAGAAVGSMPERTTLYGAGGLVAYFDGGWEKPSVTLFRGNAKQTLRCEAQQFRLTSAGYSHNTKTTFRCFDTPVGSTAAENCQVLFHRTISLGFYGGSELADEMEASCWNGDRTSTKQKAFLKFVLGEAQTTTVPNKDRTEPTAEQTYARALPLSTKNVGKDVDADPYMFSWTVLSAVREVAVQNRLYQVDVSSPGVTISMSALDREYKPMASKGATLVEGGKTVAYPEMVKRIRTSFGLK